MSFFHLLRENHFDWDKSKEAFYELTDLRIMWINAIVEKERDDHRREMEETEKSAGKRFGKGGVETNKKSFDLKG